MNQSFHLFQLQKVDTQIEEIQTRISQIKESLSSDKRIIKANEKIKKCKIDLSKERKNLRTVEEKTKDIRFDIENNESSLYSGRISNPRELNDLQEKIASDKRRMSLLEDEQIEAMISVESCDADLKKSKNNLNDTQAKVSMEQAELRGEQENLISKNTRLATEREVKLRSVNSESLTIYTNLCTRKRGVAVSSVEDKTCSACGSTLTPSEWQAARSPHQIVYCSICGRILYSG